jgi:flagellar hook assembly protein FlgD
MTRLLLIAVLAALALPAVARAEATLVSRDLPLRLERSSAVAAPRFDLVGLHWRGVGSVEFRTRSTAGRWSAWHPAAPEAEDAPDAPERSRSGWRIGNPYWTGPSDAIEYRTRGAVRRLRAHFVRSAVSAVPARTLTLAESPPIVPRLSWGADESIRRAAPAYAPSLQIGIVHHTAGANTYTRQESGAIVRAIQVYHVRGNGWNDLGYNFLVDKYGQVFEGRYGGLERNVVGAHAEGFNTGSVGVAVLGNYDAQAISPAAQAALARVLAWRMDVAHLDPLQIVSFISRGNPRFPAGVPVTLRAIVGHRDTGFTDCPGDRLYARLGALAQMVSQTGLPKLYTPVVRGRLGGPVRFTALLTASLPWTVTISDSAGAAVASGSGTGTAVDWTWDATLAPPGRYSYAVGAGPTVRPAAGTIGAAAGLSLSQAKAEPATVSPNGDGVDDATTISYTLGASATVTATLVDPAGTTLATLFSEIKTAGPQSFTFTADGVPDGTYRIVLTAVNGGGATVTATVDVIVSRVLSSLAVEADAFSPNGDGRLDTVRFTFALAEPAAVRLRIRRGGAWVATPFDGSLQTGPQAVEWDGRKRRGRALDGNYEAELTVATAASSVTQRLPFRLDTAAPTLRLVTVWPLRLRVSEAATIVVTVAGRRREIRAARPGLVRVPLRARPSRIRASARDAAGNTSRPLRHG